MVNTLVLGTIPIPMSVIFLVKKSMKRASLLLTFPLDPRLYGVYLKLAGSLTHKFGGGSFLHEGCHSFQPVLGWDVLGIAHLFNGHPDAMSTSVPRSMATLPKHTTVGAWGGISLVSARAQW